MAAPFGFSVSDLIKGIELIGVVVDSLKKSGRAGEEHRQLLCQLHALEAVYLELKDLNANRPQPMQNQVLHFTVSQCQTLIDDFWARNRKYQNLSARVSDDLRDDLKERWRTIKWALYKKADIRELKSNLTLYTGLLQVLLTIDQR